MSPVVYMFAKSRQDFLDEAIDSLENASKRMKKYADKRRRPLEFEQGEIFLLKVTPHILKNIKYKHFRV